MQDIHLVILNLLSFSMEILQIIRCRKIEHIPEHAPCAVYKSQTETYKELLTRTKLSTLYHRRLQVIAILIKSNQIK